MDMKMALNLASKTKKAQDQGGTMSDEQAALLTLARGYANADRRAADLEGADVFRAAVLSMVQRGELAPEKLVLAIRALDKPLAERHRELDQKMKDTAVEMSKTEALRGNLENAVTVVVNGGVVEQS